MALFSFWGYWCPYLQLRGLLRYLGCSTSPSPSPRYLQSSGLHCSQLRRLCGVWSHIRPSSPSMPAQRPPSSTTQLVSTLVTMAEKSQVLLPTALPSSTLQVLWARVEFIAPLWCGLPSHQAIVSGEGTLIRLHVCVTLVCITALWHAMALERPSCASWHPRLTSGIFWCPTAEKGASLSFVTLLWPFQALHLNGGPEEACFAILQVFARKQTQGLDWVPSEAERASWTFCCSPVGLFVPRGTAKPPSLPFAPSYLYLCCSVRVRYTVWPSIGLGSVQCHFVCMAPSSRFAVFHRVSWSSQLCWSGFARFGAY